MRKVGRGMNSSMRWAGMLSIAGVLGACAETDRQDSPEVRFEREAAYRQACVAQLLAQRAADDLTVVQAALPADDATPSDPLAGLARQASLAAYEFALAYQRHADLRATAYAFMDSAVNRAETSADSVRYIERASAFSINAPSEGTMEATVITRYQENIAAMLANADHPCNWDFPF